MSQCLYDQCECVESVILTVSVCSCLRSPHSTQHSEMALSRPPGQPSRVFVSRPPLVAGPGRRSADRLALTALVAGAGSSLGPSHHSGQCQEAPRPQSQCHRHTGKWGRTRGRSFLFWSASDGKTRGQQSAYYSLRQFCLKFGICRMIWEKLTTPCSKSKSKSKLSPKYLRGHIQNGKLISAELLSGAYPSCLKVIGVLKWVGARA